MTTWLFGLKLRKMPKDQIDKAVKNAADILGLAHYLDRKPAALSGGETTCCVRACNCKRCPGILDG